jgi:hypothetical protein
MEWTIICMLIAFIGGLIVGITLTRPVIMR